MKKSEITKQEALERLFELGIKPGDKIYVSLKHVARSGMSRVIQPFYIKDNQPIDITRECVALGVGSASKKYAGVVVGGYGMDMGFALVYALGSALYPDGFKTWDGYWRNEPLSFDRNGGYALQRVWL